MLIKRVTELFRSDDPSHRINYKWPKQVSYENPITAIKSLTDRTGDKLFCFRRQSGEKTDYWEKDAGFIELFWSKIAYFVIKYHSYDLIVTGFECYNAEQE